MAAIGSVLNRSPTSSAWARPSGAGAGSPWPSTSGNAVPSTSGSDSPWRTSTSSHPPGGVVKRLWRNTLGSGMAAERTDRPVIPRTPYELGWGRSGAVAVGDGEAAVLAEGLGRDPHARRGLAALVLGQVDEADDPLHERRVEAGLYELAGRAVVLDVGLD